MTAPKAKKGEPRREKLKDVFARLEVGDSVFIPPERASEYTARSMAAIYQKQLGYRLSTRVSVEDGVRGIRVKRIA